MERLRTWSQNSFEKLLVKGYNFEIEGKNNLDALNDEPNNPAVFIFNHTATDDPFFIYHIAYDYSPERMGNVIVPVSEWHSKFKNSPKYSAIVGLGDKLLGFEMPKIVQSYRLRTSGETDDSLMNKSSELGKNFLRLIDTKLPSGPLIMISPEGHRSDSGKMLPAEGGAGAIAQIMQKYVDKGVLENGYFLPVGIKVSNFKSKKMYYNPSKKENIKCIVGEPLSIKVATDFSKKFSDSGKVDSRIISHFLMTHVARLLAEEMRGVYHSDFLKDTFNGRFEQRTNENGKVYIHDIWNNSPFSE